MKNGFRRTLCFLLVAMLLPIMAMPAYAATTGKNGLFNGNKKTDEGPPAGRDIVPAPSSRCHAKDIAQLSAHDKQ